MSVVTVFRKSLWHTHRAAQGGVTLWQNAPRRAGSAGGVTLWRVHGRKRTTFGPYQSVPYTPLQLFQCPTDKLECLHRFIQNSCRRYSEV